MSDLAILGPSRKSDFPILESSRKHLPTLPRGVPWEFVAQFEKQAQSNHSQTLKRLAERGGLCWTELADVVEGKSWDMQTFTTSTPAEAARYVAKEALAALRVLTKLKEWRDTTGGVTAA